MITEDKVTEIFCIADDFCKIFDAQMAKYTFKHLICNEKGELLNFMITPGDVDDRKPLEYKAFVEFIYGKLVGDRGYIGKNLFERLFVDGIQLITKLKSNMKGAMMSVSDKLLLRKRAITETINDELKNIAQVEHSKHRCFDNFMVNLLVAIDEKIAAKRYDHSKAPLIIHKANLLKRMNREDEAENLLTQNTHIDEIRN